MEEELDKTQIEQLKRIDNFILNGFSMPKPYILTSSHMFCVFGIWGNKKLFRKNFNCIDVKQSLIDHVIYKKE